MNAVRTFFSVFLLALLAVCVAGWKYAGGMPSPKLEGARVVLALSGIAALGCLWLLWSAKPMDGTARPRDSGAGRSLVWLLCLSIAAGCSPSPSSQEAVRFDVSLDPAKPSVGDADVMVRLEDASGAPVEGATVRVEGNMNHAGMKPSFADLSEETAGTYAGTIDFTMGGDWYLLVTATLPSGTTAEHQVNVRGVAAQ